MLRKVECDAKCAKKSSASLKGRKGKAEYKFVWIGRYGKKSKTANATLRKGNATLSAQKMQRCALKGAKERDWGMR
jgi:hypothetical protein